MAALSEGLNDLRAGQFIPAEVIGRVEIGED
jgi:hypothetical protein